ncbi:SH3 domain-containing protein [Flavobacterium psychrophilum]|nr:SH3 domain-containing protein [Flavobacterium psychrophilum]
MRTYKVLVVLLLVLGCKDSKIKDSIKKDSETKVISNDKLNNKNNKMNTNIEIVEFHDLFNEGSLIKFGVNNLNNTSDVDLIEFKRKLQLFEAQHTIREDFEPDDIKLLINDETFFEAKSYINSEWLDYFLNKYDLYYEFNELVELAIKQEDLNAIKVLIKHKYIISKNDLIISTERKVEVNEIINKKGDEDFYVVKNSKIDEILKLITKKYNSNKIYDKDGYTNLRESKGTNSLIISKIDSGEHINVLENPDEEDWYLIQTKEGKKGYIHRSRILSE